jgi:protein-tyrosine phosphatase
MAEALFRQSFANLFGRLGPGIEVRSCGLTALVGQPADPAALSLMRERGIDIGAHRARQIDPAQVAWADLILVMERLQKDIIQAQMPSAGGKVFRLGHFSDTDIPDPYRQSIDRFAEVLQVIDENVASWVHETIQDEAASG